jgi:hypothetical protein
MPGMTIKNGIYRRKGFCRFESVPVFWPNVLNGNISYLGLESHKKPNRRPDSIPGDLGRSAHCVMWMRDYISSFPDPPISTGGSFHAFVAYQTGIQNKQRTGLSLIYPS